MAASEKSDRDAAEVRASGAPTSSASSEASATNAANIANERFDEILARLRGVVERLEGGNLSLEDSLKFFEEGIGLCRRGAMILDSAERKVEVLLGASGKEGAAGAPRTAPFDVSSGQED